MIWFFTRDSAQVDIEVRRLADAGLFELVVDYPDGSEEVERFRNPRRLVKRTLSIQRRLIHDGWVPTGPGCHRGSHAAHGAHRPRRPRTRLRTMPRLMWSYVQRQVGRRIAATFGF